MKTKIVRKLTPTQLRAKLVSILKTFDFFGDAQCREFGRNKAWLSRKRHVGAETAKRIAKAIKRSKVTPVAHCRKGYGGEYIVSGPGYSIALNSDGSRGAFVQTVKYVSEDWAAHDGYPGTLGLSFTIWS